MYEDKTIDSDLYTQFINIDSSNPFSNNLLIGGEIPEFVESNTVFDQPIHNIYDLTVLNVFFSNGFYRIQEGMNDELVMFIHLPPANALFTLRLRVPPGNYSTEQMEQALNFAWENYGGDITAFPNARFLYFANGNGTTPAHLDIPKANPTGALVFQLTSHALSEHTMHTVVRMTLPNQNSTLSIATPAPSITNVRLVVPNLNRSMAETLGFSNSTSLHGMQSSLPTNVANLQVEIKSITYHNIDFSQRNFYIQSRAIGQLAELKPISYNGLGKADIIYSIPSDNASLEPINHPNPFPDHTRIRFQDRSSLKNLDLQILDESMNRISNQKLETFKILLAIRVFKRRF